MSPENPKKETTAATKDETRKTRPPDPQHLNCPRCDSANTKFCYYNNYSLTQPRHFCKTCRRYWTKGGALRNVPIGGGCRKTKKIKSGGSSSISRSVEFFHGGGTSLSTSPAMDFQLGGSSSSSLIIPRVVHQYPNNSSSGIYTQFSSFGHTSASAAASSTIIDPLVGSCFNMAGFNFPLKQQGGGDIGGGGVIQGLCVDSNLASSIESLSCINQDLHWKLQQQRLSMLFGGAGGGGDDRDKDTNFVENHQKLLQPILFQNLEISRKDSAGGGASGSGGGGDTATEWYFDNSYAPGNNTATPVNNVVVGGGGGSNHQDNNVAASNNWNNNGIQAWNDLHQYTSNLP